MRRTLVACPLQVHSRCTLPYHGCQAMHAEPFCVGCRWVVQVKKPPHSGKMFLENSLVVCRL